MNLSHNQHLLKAKKKIVKNVKGVSEKKSNELMHLPVASTTSAALSRDKFVCSSINGYKILHLFIRSYM